VSAVFEAQRSRDAVEALLGPRTIAIVGANDRPGSWSARTWQNLKQAGFPGAVFAVNPRRTEIWDAPCYPNLGALPDVPDHIAILVPAPAVADVLREAARAGARSATIFTSGIGDATEADGLARGAEVERAIRETGLAVSGPNCMGNFCARTRLVTLNDTRALPAQPGDVAMVGQSGGVMLFTAHALADRGIGVGYIVTSGNELGLTTADYITAFAADPAVRVIVSYVEGIRDAAAFRAACAFAHAAGKRIVLLKMGRTRAGREAALAHTGAVAGRIDVFDAIVGELGVIRVDSADDVIETVELVLHAPQLRGRRLAGLTLSGAFRGMLLDAAAENGLTFAALAPETNAALGAVLGAGAMVGNPVDGGFGVVTSAEIYAACIAALDADPNVDALIVQEELARAPEPPRSERWMTVAQNFAAAGTAKPIVYTSFVSYGLTPYSRELRTRLPNIAILQESARALKAIARVVRCAELEALAATEMPPSNGVPATLFDGLPEDGQLDEEQSKAIVRAFGIPMLDETMLPALRAKDVHVTIGIQRDPEMGIVVTAMTGGTFTRLIDDVAFAAAPISRAKAEDLIERTRIGRLMTDFRGVLIADRDGLIDALVSLGRLASAYGDRVESVDVPFTVGPAGRTSAALDAHVVLRR